MLVYLVRFFREAVDESVKATVAGGLAVGATPGALRAIAQEDLAYPLSRALLRRVAHEEAALHAAQGDPRSAEKPLIECGGGVGRMPEEGGVAADATGGGGRVGRTAAARGSATGARAGSPRRRRQKP